MNRDWLAACLLEILKGIHEMTFTGHVCKIEE